MEDNKQEGQGKNFFDSLMFGPPPQRSNSIEQQKNTATEVPDEQTQTQQQNQAQESIEQPSQPQESNEQPQLDLVQMMQQFDSLMEYANKLGPSLKKLGPLFDLFKGFNEKK